MIPTPEASSLTAVVETGADMISGNVARNLSEVAAANVGGPLAGAGLSLMITATNGVIQSKADDLSRGLDVRLKDIADRLDEEDPKQATLIRGVEGFSNCLPRSDEFEKSLTQAINGDSERLANFIEQYASDSEKRESLENAVEKVLSGEIDEMVDENEHDDFIEYFQDSFGAETRDDAIKAFMDVRKLFVSKQVRAVLQDTTELKLTISDIDDKIERTEESLNTRFTSILEANLKDEGFDRLSPYYFEQHEPGDPATNWRTGFGLKAVHAGRALDRTEPTERPRTKCSETLISALKSGENRVVLGRPGTGKSTLCKIVACRWYDNRYGTVFYRESGAQQFSRAGILEERIRQAERHILVVVEDVARENAKDILKLLLEFRGDDSVSFLLDSRIEEWDSLTRELTNPRVLNLKQELGQYYVPDFDEYECARALRKFKKHTDHEVRETPEGLLEAIETDHGVGEMYLLGHRLSSFDFDQPNTLLADVRTFYNNITSQEDEMARKIALTINILNAAGRDIHPEILHALTDSGEGHERVDEVIYEFAGRLLFRGDGAHQSHHPYWSQQYLAYACENDANSTIRLFEKCLNSIFHLIDEPQKRDGVREWYRYDMETDYFDQIEQDPQGTADSIVQDIFEIGRRHPTLAPLFNTSSHSDIEIPDSCSPKIALNAIMWRGEMYLKKGELEKAKAEFQSLLERADETETLSDTTTETIKGQAYLDLGELFRKHGKLEQARNRLERSIEVFDSLGNSRWKARSYAELGVVERRNANLKDADRWYEKSINLSRDVNYKFGEVIALNNRAMVKKDRGNLESAEKDAQRALKKKRDCGHSPSSVAISYNTLGEIYYEWGKLDDAEWHLNRSLQKKQLVGYRSGIAWSQYYLGLVKHEQGEIEKAREYLTDSLEIRQDIEDPLGQGRCLNALSELSIENGKLNQAEGRLDRSLSKIEEVGDSMGMARNELYRAHIKLDRGELAEADAHFSKALEKFREIDHNRGLARSYRGLSHIKKRLGKYDESIDYLKRAHEQMVDLSSSRYEKPIVDDLIEVCERGGFPTEAWEWEERLSDLET